MSKRKTARFQRAAYNQMLRAARELDRQHLELCLEAIVFAAPEPMTLRDLARATGARRRDVETALGHLDERYAGRGIHLVETNEGFTFLTNPTFGPEVRAVTGKKPVRMSRAQLETLAIIAYRQPVTRPEIDEVRGVDSGPVLRTLLERELIRIIGKKEEPGRPLLYGTSEDFLKLLGIKALSELPTLREFTELTEDSRETYERTLGDRAPTGEIDFDDDPGAIRFAEDERAGAASESHAQPLDEHGAAAPRAADEPAAASAGAEGETAPTEGGDVEPSDETDEDDGEDEQDVDEDESYDDLEADDLYEEDEQDEKDD